MSTTTMTRPLDTPVPAQTRSWRERIHAPREPLDDHILPDYTQGEEIFNMVTHIVGAAMSLIFLMLSLFQSLAHRSVVGIVTGTLFAISMLVCYTISSVYHGIPTTHPDQVRAKKAMQVLDHCDIYFLIAGTYTPIAMGALRTAYPVLAYLTLSIVWGVCLLGTVFTAIDFHKYGPLSYACYFVAGWSVLVAIPTMWKVYSPDFVVLLLAGGVVYTTGMIFFVRQVKGHRYAHSVFHLFILAGSVLQFLSIFLYCL